MTDAFFSSSETFYYLHSPNTKSHTVFSQMETHQCRPSQMVKRARFAPCPLDIENACDGNMLKLVVTHAQALGVPAESVLLPLLACVAGFLSDAQVQVRQGKGTVASQGCLPCKTNPG